jgi:MerR family transcriptional regulator, light-induced transcriptional regulator
MRYSVGAAARATGITEGRLRTWERRYGIPAPARSNSGRRIYEDADLETIRRMAALVGSGVPAALAAEAVRSGASPAEDRVTEASAPGSHPAAEALVGHARRFDDASARAVVRDVAATLGWSEACDRVFFPALLRVGDAWETGDVSTAHEHFLSEVLQSEMFAVAVATAPPSPEVPLVLLACAEGELHSLGLTALWLGLLGAGLRTCYLGANVPTEALILATRETGASAVCIAGTVSTSRPTLGQAARALSRLRPAPRVFVGGPVIDRESSLGRLGGAPLPPSVSEATAAVVTALSRPER